MVTGQRLIVLAAITVVALLLQTVVFPVLTIFGWRPHLIGLVVIGLALTDGPGAGARYGFGAGLLTDLANGGSQLLGLSALILLLVGYAAGLVRPYLSGTGMVGPIAVAAVGSTVAVLGFALLAFLLEVAPLSFGEAVEGTLFTAAYNTALAPLVFPLVERVSRRYPPRPAASLAGA